MRLTRRTLLRLFGAAPAAVIPARLAGAEERLMAGRYDLVIRQGETLTREIAWRDAAGALVNLSGYSARAHVRGNVADASPALEMTTGNGRISLGSFGSGDWTWNITIAVAAATTAALDDWGEGVWDLEMESGGGVVTRLLEGQSVLSLEVSQ